MPAPHGDRVRYVALVEKEEISRSYTMPAKRRPLCSRSGQWKPIAPRLFSRQQAIAKPATWSRSARLNSKVRRRPRRTVTDARARSDFPPRDIWSKPVPICALLNSTSRLYEDFRAGQRRDRTQTVELATASSRDRACSVIVPLDDIWITANFKETQLKRMRPGQSVTIRVDTFGGDYKGKVESLPGAAGPLFSLFPPKMRPGTT